MKFLFFGLFLIFQTSHAEDLRTFALSVKDGKFTPERIEVPRDKKFKLEVKNDGNQSEEFESVELNREKIVGPHKSITVFLGPLGTGEYVFFGDFHPDTARGKIVVK